jgi:hypothetical protein
MLLIIAGGIVDAHEFYATRRVFDTVGRRIGRGWLWWVYNGSSTIVKQKLKIREQK